MPKVLTIDRKKSWILWGWPAMHLTRLVSSIIHGCNVDSGAWRDRSAVLYSMEVDGGGRWCRSVEEPLEDGGDHAPRSFNLFD